MFLAIVASCSSLVSAAESRLVEADRYVQIMAPSGNLGTQIFG